MTLLKKPLFLIVLAFGLIAIIGSITGWFAIGNQVYQSIVESALNRKEYLLIVITLFCVLIYAVLAVTNKRKLAFAVLPIALYGLVLVINQKPESSVVSQLQITINPGYWMSIVGSLGLVLSSVIIGIKGFNLFAGEEPDIDTK